MGRHTECCCRGEADGVEQGGIGQAHRSLDKCPGLCSGGLGVARSLRRLLPGCWAMIRRVLATTCSGPQSPPL